MAYIPLHHKYRPQTFAGLVGQEAIATTLTNALQLQRIAPAYLFTGPRGTGKTSSARILAKSLNCMASAVPTAQPCGICEVCKSIASGAALDIIEIDAASNTGVDNIREIIERAQYAPVLCRYKVYIIDECHMLTTAAFNSLLKTLEEPPAQVVFVLATTDPQRVLPTIISRCQRFDYRRIPLKAMVEHLIYIAKTEEIEIPTESITLIAQIAEGGLRDAESLLDRLSLLSGDITPDRIPDAIGSVPEKDLLDLLQAIASNDPEGLLDKIRTILERGKEPLTVLQNLAGCYRDLLIAKTAPTRPDLVALTSETWTKLCQIAKSWQVRWILEGQKSLKDSEVQIKHTTQPRLWLEITLLGLLPVISQQPQTQPISVAAVNPPPTVAPPQPSPVSQITVSPQLAPQHTPASVPVGAIAPTDSNLVAIWEQVLQQLLPSSKDLFRSYGTLMSLTQEQAVVAMKSSTMQTIATGKIPELVKIFSTMLSRQILVRLEVKGKPQTLAAASVQPLVPITIVPDPPAPPPIVVVETPPPALAIAPPPEPVIAPLAIVSPPVTPPLPIPTPTLTIVPPPVPIQPPAPTIEPEETELESPMDFDEPPDSFDSERSTHISLEQSRGLEPEPEIDPDLQAATNNVVNIFNGEIIDRHHDLYNKIIDE